MDSDTEGKLLVTVADAARTLSLSPRTVWNLISCGRLVPLRLGRRTLLRVVDLHALVERRAASLADDQDRVGGVGGRRG